MLLLRVSCNFAISGNYFYGNDKETSSTGSTLLLAKMYVQTLPGTFYD
jgi:hypothetical protein